MGIAKEHLSESERQAIAKELFQVTTEEKTGELHGLCPIHGEKNPSFSYNYVKDHYNCFSCKATGDLAALWAHNKGYSDNRQGFVQFCNHFQIPIGGGDKSNAPPPPLKVKRREFQPEQTVGAGERRLDHPVHLQVRFQRRLIQIMRTNRGIGQHGYHMRLHFEDTTGNEEELFLTVAARLKPG